jgi:hypothetical protein
LIICLRILRARLCSFFAQNTCASSSCHSDTPQTAELYCLIWNIALSGSWNENDVWEQLPLLFLLLPVTHWELDFCVRTIICISVLTFQPPASLPPPPCVSNHWLAINTVNYIFSFYNKEIEVKKKNTLLKAYTQVCLIPIQQCPYFSKTFLLHSCSLPSG